jgi:hypothetical protein
MKGGVFMANKPGKSSDSDYYARAIIWILVGAGLVIGGLVLFLRLTGTLR